MLTKVFRNEEITIFARPNKRVRVIMPHPFNPGEEFCTKDPHDILNQPNEYTPQYTLNPGQKSWLKRVLLEIGDHEPKFKFYSDRFDGYHRFIRRNDRVTALFRKDATIDQPRIVGLGDFAIDDIDLTFQMIDQIKSLNVIPIIQEFDEAQRTIQDIIDELHKFQPKIK